MNVGFRLSTQPTQERRSHWLVFGAFVRSHFLLTQVGYPSNHRLGMVKMDKIVSEKIGWFTQRKPTYKERRAHLPIRCARLILLRFVVVYTGRTELTIFLFTSKKFIYSVSNSSSSSNRCSSNYGSTCDRTSPDNATNTSKSTHNCSA